ncbi:hypothetical protein CQ010_16110 [Arthrobacter sp. MYb211]|uniref:DUF58 domain-containing protein n=1 Tax=Micrococcaceae TaxID=1268 RepID=UPI000CFD5620|nr:MULTISPECIES: DUF58 domain-containing protein [unclassified Arthrobacter]PQZ98307.1 hypothetical protein CQ017_11890 [Arthrobacter sp. MYb224]PQZ98539.1 hypothetical protein CQ019_17035 [Arthrobacter sp. MYb229]PRA09954.1 hypothetical protein CQ015_16095 [Arthrobacter sp. MYb221]PRB47219.1 hypothetical protein CQ013_17185 [Arthrobacter sp. MYb216]PRC05035.1 hypothetical protein CQ010_16110 [Arthrobacter sp. MYb211]
MEKMQRFDSRDALSWTRTDSTPATLRRFQLDLFTVRGWATLCSGALLIFLAYILGRHEMMALGIGLLTVALVSWLLVLRLRNKSKLTRKLLTANPVVGDITRLQLSCAENAKVKESLPPEFGPGPEFTGPGETVYELIFRTRGIHLVGPAKQILSDPLGLVDGMVDSGDALPVPVCAEIHPLERFASLGDKMLTGDARFSRSTTADYYDVATRDYQQGDSIRQVHWKATARQGKLMVRQENHVATAQALLVFDRTYEHWHINGADLRLGIPQGDGPPIPSSRRFEMALSLACSIGQRYAANGYQLLFRELSGEQLLKAGSVSLSGASAQTGFEDFHAASAEMSLRAPTNAAEGPEILGEGLRKLLLGFRDEPVIMILGELRTNQAAWLATLARSVRHVELFLLVSHPERYREVQQHLAETGWKVHFLAANTNINELWSRP